MDQILAIRPFVPAKDFDASKRFYRALGFTLTHEDESIAILKLGSFSFILQNFYAKEFAENCMIQLLVRDVDSGERLFEDPCAQKSCKNIRCVFRIFQFPLFGMPPTAQVLYENLIPLRDYFVVITPRQFRETVRVTCHDTVERHLLFGQNMSQVG